MSSFNSIWSPFIWCLPPTFQFSIDSFTSLIHQHNISTNNMLYKTLSWICRVSLSVTKTNKCGLNVDIWCKLTVIENSGLSPLGALMLVITFSYISLYIYVYVTLTLFFTSTLHMISRWALSYVFFKSMKPICKSCFFFRYLSINFLKRWIASIVDFPGKNPNWFLNTLSFCEVSLHNLLRLFYIHRYQSVFSLLVKHFFVLNKRVQKIWDT